MRRLGIAAIFLLVALLLLARAVAERRAAARAPPGTDGSAPRPLATAPETTGSNGAPLPPETVRVQVLDAATRLPLAGATIVSGRHSGTTGADGYASLTLEWEDGISAHAPGFVPSDAIWPDEGDDDLWIPLRPGIPVAGRVVHADFTPAVLAEVEVKLGPDLTLRPDEQGSVDIPGLPQGEEVRVRAGEEGYHPEEIVFTATPERTSFEIVLGRGGACEGVVLDEERRPVSGARVTVVEEFHARNGRFFDAAWCRTDDKGRFAIRGLPPLYPGVPQCGPPPYRLDDRYRARAVAPDGRTGESGNFAAGPDAPAHRCEIVVRPSAYVVASVTYADGTPVKDASVRFGGSRTEPGAPGEYRSAPVFPGPLGITVRARGWADRTLEVEVKPGVRNDVAIRLEKGLDLAGTVVDGEGRPLEGLAVHFGEARDVTGSDGTFRLRGLGADPDTLEILGDGYLRVSTVARPGQPPARIVLDRRVPKVVGRIDPPPPVRLVFADFGDAEDLVYGDTAYVDREGRFEFSAPVGIHWLLIQVEGSAPWVLTRIETGPGTKRDLGVLRMHEGVTVKGVVVDPDGQPIENASVEAYSAARYVEAYYAGTDWEGRFAIARLPDTPLTFDVKCHGRVTRVLDVERPREHPSLNVVLEPGGALEVTGSEEPIAVELVGSGSTFTLGPEATITLPPGRYRVGGRIVEIRVGETTVVELGD